MSNETIAFNGDQQAAILGHALHTPALWERLEILSVDKQWFIDANIGVGYEQVVKYRAAHKHPPTFSELISFVDNTDSKQKKNIQAVLATAKAAAKEHNLEVLMSKLHSWAKARLIKEKGQKLNAEYGAGNHEEAFKIWQEGAAELARLDFTVGQTDSFDTSANRITNEEKDRAAEAGKILPFGISFLDDALGGIFPKDLIMIGARSGAGKTDLAKSIARHNAENGKHVHAFFLEAEGKEIERRIKYQMLADMYFAEYPPGQRPPGLPRISYKLWRMNKLQDELDKPFGKIADELIREKLKTLHTYYREKSVFGIREMEREILRIHEEADLILLDHLHYVDLEGDDENREMTKLVSKLNDISLGRGKPIIVVAHINKAAGQVLVPGMNDFHGSSNITKVARTGIMLAPAKNSVMALDKEARGTPTFMRIVKCRIDGSVLYNTAVSYFDTDNNTYCDKYSIGHLNFPGTKWEVEKEHPYWAERGTVTEVQEID